VYCKKAAPAFFVGRHLQVRQGWARHRPHVGAEAADLQLRVKA
jgi:hypothetical protein